jgi:hypothetical protein
VSRQEVLYGHSGAVRFHHGNTQAINYSLPAGLGAAMPKSAPVIDLQIDKLIPTAGFSRVEGIEQPSDTYGAQALALSLQLPPARFPTIRPWQF